MSKKFFKVFKYLSALMYCSLLGFTLVEVFFRYVLKNSLGWPQRIATISFIYLVFSYGAIIIIESGLLKVELIGKLFSDASNNIRILVVKVLSLITFVWMTIDGINITKFCSTQIDVRLGICYSYIYFALPLGFFLMSLATIYSIKKQIKDDQLFTNL